MQNVSFISLEFLKKNTMIQENVDSETIRPFIILAQEKYILPILGTSLYNKIATDVIANALTGNYLILMETYLQQVLAWHTMEESISFINFQLTNKSVLTKNSENSTAADKDDIIFLERKIANNASYYSQRMINYLQANYTLFPELTNNKADAATIFPVHTQYFGGIHIAGLPLEERLKLNKNKGINYDSNGYYY